MLSFSIRLPSRYPAYLLGLFIAVNPACKKKENAATLANVNVEAKERPAVFAPASKGDGSFGHARIANFADFLAKARQIAPAAMRADLEESSVRKRMSEGQSGARIEALGESIDLSQPIAALLYDPQKHDARGEWPGVVGFSYRGGAQAFVAANHAHLNHDVSPHLARGEHGSTLFYVDPVAGEQMALSGADSLFAAASTTLRTELLDTKAATFGHAELVVDVGEIYKIYAPQYLPMAKMALAAAGAAQTNSDIPDAKLREALAASQKEQMDKLLAVVAELSTVAMAFDLDSESAALRFGATPLPSGSILKAAAKGADGKLDLNLLARLPASSVAAWSAHYDLAHYLNSEENAALRDATRLYYEAFFGSAGQTIYDEWHAVAQAIAPTLTPKAAMAMWVETTKENTEFPCGAAIWNAAKDQNPLQAIKQSLPAFAEKFNAQASTYVTSKFEPDAYTNNKVSISRWTLTLTTAGEAEIKSKIGDSSWQQIAKISGGTTLSVEFAQVESIFVATMAMNTSSAAMERALSGLVSGKGTLHERPEFAQIADWVAGNGFAMAINLEAVTSWVRRVLGPTQVPPFDLGADLRDMVLSARVAEDGKMSMEMRTTTTLLQKALAQANK
jgi:hypothetical protein